MGKQIMAGITVAQAQAIYEEGFAPWVKALDITIEEISSEGARLRMKYGDHLTRTGGMICGQSLVRSSAPRSTGAPVMRKLRTRRRRG